MQRTLMTTINRPLPLNTAMAIGIIASIIINRDWQDKLLLDYNLGSI